MSERWSRVKKLWPCANRVCASSQHNGGLERLALPRLNEHFFSCVTCAKDIFRGAPLKTNWVKCPMFQNKPPPPLRVMYGRAGRVTELWLSSGTFSWSCEGCGRDAHKADTGLGPCHHDSWVCLSTQCHLWRRPTVQCHTTSCLAGSDAADAVDDTYWPQREQPRKHCWPPIEERLCFMAALSGRCNQL